MWKQLQLGWMPPDIVTENDYKEIRNNLDKDKALSGFTGVGCAFAGKWLGGYARGKDEKNYLDVIGRLGIRK